MKKFNLHYILLFLALFSIGFSSCSDDNPIDENAVKQIKLYLTDDPIDAEEVNIEIVSIILKGNGSEEIELNTLSGVYNLLDYTGDLDTLIASGNYDLDKIKEIILILGDDNTIVIDGQVFPLNIPNDRKAIKIKVDVDLSENVLFDLLIDFDACESVKEQNGQYSLSPVIRFKGNRNRKTMDKSVIVALTECYELQFPVKALTPDGKSIDIEDLETLYMNYDEESIFGVEYPLVVADINGNLETIRNGNQADKLIKICREEEEGKDLAEIIERVQKCFEVVYPINVLDLNNMVVVIENLEALKEKEDLADFDYPFYIYSPSGDSIPINNIHQLEGRIKNCHEGEVDGIRVKAILDSLSSCYTLEFPITIKLEDGTTTEIFSIDELEMLPGQPYGISFPIYILEGPTDKSKINNLNQVKRLLEACEDEKEMETFDVLEVLSRLENCVSIVFPVTGIKENGETYDIDSLQEIFTMDVKTVNLVFPFFVLDEEGNEKPINNLNQLKAQLNNCGDREEIAFEDLVALIQSCYEIKFPLEVKVKTDSSLLLITGIDALWQAINDYEIYSFVYPIEIVDDEGKSKKINNSQQLKAMTKKCDQNQDDLITEINRCYTFKFPVTVIARGNEKLVANDLDELMKYWEEYDHLRFEYPLFLIDKEDNVKEIKNRGKLNDALKNCN